MHQTPATDEDLAKLLSELINEKVNEPYIDDDLDQLELELAEDPDALRVENLSGIDFHLNKRRPEQPSFASSHKFTFAASIMVLIIASGILLTL